MKTFAKIIIYLFFPVIGLLCGIMANGAFLDYQTFIDGTPLQNMSGEEAAQRILESSDAFKEYTILTLNSTTIKTEGSWLMLLVVSVPMFIGLLISFFIVRAFINQKENPTN